jgi:hypothetical protein
MADENRDLEHAAVIERLKAQAAAAAGGRMVVHEGEGLSLDAREEFWGRVVAFETSSRPQMECGSARRTQNPSTSAGQAR